MTKRRCATAAVMAAAVLFTAAPAAGAAVGGSVDDPQDTLPPLSGARQVDLARVTVTFERADGTLSVTARTYEPWNATLKSYPSFGMTLGSGVTSSRSCSSFNAGDATIIGVMDPQSSGPGTLSVMGFTGQLPLTRSFSDDGLEVTWTVSAGPLVGRSYICADLVRLFRSDPDGHCSPSLSNCQRIEYSYTGDTVPSFFFSGFAPAPFACQDGVDNDEDGLVDTADTDCYGITDDNEGVRPSACSNRRDDDGDDLIDLKDPGCRGRAAGDSEVDPEPVASTVKRLGVSTKRRCRIDVDVDVQPDIAPAALFPFEPVTINVRGIGGAGRGYVRTRRLPLRDDPGYAFKVKRGRYRVSAIYPGDRFRLDSPKRSRVVTVRCPSRRR